MNQRIRKLSLLAGILLVWAIGGHALEPQKPMPPRFSFETDPAEVLHNYPLGVITEQDAFAHHGGAVRKVTLPNGNPGWLYTAGENAGVPSIYVLEFSRDGLVIDVLHKDYRYKIGHSALQYQYLQHVEAELQTLGPGPGE
ncbi:MAG TPA: hypothetical protein VET88_03240 [Gammaproteobacteria bacterium]|nr:hypothetical protein [Gammaproteobacteria bacterium]